MGGVPFGPFVLEGRIASGGSAEVWSARPAVGDLPAPRLVVKRLLPSLLGAPDARGAFAKEAALYRHCSHPNVVTCYGTGFADEEPWLALELVPGADLDTVLRDARKRGRPLEPGVAVHIAREILAGLAAMHEVRAEDGAALGILHRDVTPSNIYLSVDGAVKLGDFGIARYLTAPRTPASLGVRGKFAYLAPEQVSGANLDARTDLFAVANVLAESLLGRRLFEGSGQLAVLLAVRDARIDALRTHGRHIPPRLIAVLEVALARGAENRFPDARSFAAALLPFSADAERGRRAVADLVAAVRARSEPLDLDLDLDLELDEDEDPPAPPLVVGVPSMFPAALPSKLPVPIEPSQPVILGSTAQFRPMPSMVRTTDNRTLGPLTYPELVELVANGQLSPDDEIDFLGGGFIRLREIDDLAGHLAPRKTATAPFARPGTPDWHASAVQPSDAHDGVDPSIPAALAWIAARRADGVLFATRGEQRSEIYFRRGRVLHVGGSEASAIADALVARKVLSNIALDNARRAAVRFHGDLGDALIGLGAIEAIDWSRAVIGYAREAIVTLFGWRDGELAFYRDEQPRVRAALSMLVGPIVEAGVATMMTDDRARVRRQSWRAPVVALDIPATLRDAGWSPLVERVLERTRAPIHPSTLVDELREELGADEFDCVRAIVTARLSSMLGVV